MYQIKLAALTVILAQPARPIPYAPLRGVDEVNASVAEATAPPEECVCTENALPCGSQYWTERSGSRSGYCFQLSVCGCGDGEICENPDSCDAQVAPYDNGVFRHAFPRYECSNRQPPPNPPVQCTEVVHRVAVLISPEAYFDLVDDTELSNYSPMEAARKQYGDAFNELRSGLPAAPDDPFGFSSCRVRLELRTVDRMLPGDPSSDSNEQRARIHRPGYLQLEPAQQGGPRFTIGWDDEARPGHEDTPGYLYFRVDRVGDGDNPDGYYFGMAENDLDENGEPIDPPWRGEDCFGDAPGGYDGCHFRADGEPYRAGDEDVFVFADTFEDFPQNPGLDDPPTIYTLITREISRRSSFYFSTVRGDRQDCYSYSSGNGIPDIYQDCVQLEASTGCAVVEDAVGGRAPREAYVPPFPGDEDEPGGATDIEAVDLYLRNVEYARNHGYALFVQPQGAISDYAETDAYYGVSLLRALPLPFIPSHDDPDYPPELDFAETHAKLIMHEFGHLQGLGHIADDDYSAQSGYHPLMGTGLSSPNSNLLDRANWLDVQCRDCDYLRATIEGRPTVETWTEKLPGCELNVQDECNNMLPPDAGANPSAPPSVPPSSSGNESIGRRGCGNCSAQPGQDYPVHMVMLLALLFFRLRRGARN